MKLRHNNMLCGALALLLFLSTACAPQKDPSTTDPTTDPVIGTESTPTSETEDERTANDICNWRDWYPDNSGVESGGESSGGDAWLPHIGFFRHQYDEFLEFMDLKVLNHEVLRFDEGLNRLGDFNAFYLNSTVFNNFSNYSYSITPKGFDAQTESFTVNVRDLTGKEDLLLTHMSMLSLTSERVNFADLRSIAPNGKDARYCLRFDGLQYEYSKNRLIVVWWKHEGKQYRITFNHNWMTNQLDPNSLHARLTNRNTALQAVEEFHALIGV